ncbi:T9SS type A sorting domain-containing protein [Foetidibacter luteolus]|uniref:T9SS type A sorting domain-containing protein n=1 Tax=Foetidibacter luteolus TaxID=2608880 RepID=UPI00129B6B62|nr:T9SS type A sorting domain-containing protein [Foetidibacter luteolus]
MRNIFFVLLTFSFILSFTARASITIQVKNPTANQKVSGNLDISVAVISTYDLQFVKARILATGINLSLHGEDYTGILPLTDLPYDTLTLVVTVKDIVQNTDSATVKIINQPFDSEPSFTLVNYPSFVRSIYMPIHIKAQDADGGVHLNVIGPAPDFLPLAEGDNEIDTVIDISQVAKFGIYANQIRVLGTDTAEHVISKYLTYTFEPSPYLEDFLPYGVIDFQYNKILKIVGDNYVYVDLSKNDSVILPRAVGKVQLTSFGYVQSQLNRIAVYSNDSLYYIDAVQPTTFVANGIHLLWRGGITFQQESYLTHFNLATHQTDSVSRMSYQVPNRPEGNVHAIREYAIDSLGNIALPIGVRDNYGEVYFGTRLELFLNGVKYGTGYVGAIGPLINSKKSIFRKGTPEDLNIPGRDDFPPYYLYQSSLENNTLNTTLIDTMGDRPVYLLAGDYIAYEKSATGSTWRIDPAGNKQNIGPGFLNGLNAKGEILYDFSRFFARPDGKTMPINNTPGSAFYYNNSWYINNIVLSKVNLNADTSLLNISRDILKDSSYSFTKTDFDNAASIPYEIKITALPKYGMLYFNGMPLPKDTVIRHAWLSQIVYVPDSSFEGTDTAYWNANNTLGFAADDALMLFNVLRVLPVKLTTFTGYTKGLANLLNWQTAEEKNMAYFELQRSNGDSPAFKTLGKVTTAGNSSMIRQYTYTDARPAAGINSYRLKIVDKDGRFSLSQVVRLDNGYKFASLLYPNPAHNKLFIRFNMAVAGQVSLNITSLKGGNVTSGSLLIPAGTSDKAIDISTLSPGIYFITILGDNNKTPLTLKFLKQ